MLVSSHAARAEPLRRPNIILMMADDLGWGDPGFNGNRTIATANLDAMASAGLRFARFYSGAPVCSPTRGSCLTGRHPYRYGVWDANEGHLPPAELTLAELLGKLGYRTGHFGKWHLGTLSRWANDSNRGGLRGIVHYAPPWQHGFDVCFSSEARLPTWDPMLRPLDGIPVTWKPLDPLQAAPFGTYYWNEYGERVTDNLRGDDSRVIMDRAIPFIEQAVREKRPFLAVIWFHAPHLPVVAGARYTRRYDQYDLYHRAYYGSITALDEQVGRLRARLQSLGVARHTMLWFAADNGPVGGEHAPNAPGSAGPFRGHKATLFEGGIRVPGLVEWPGKVRPATTTHFPASTLDYLPTILAAVGGQLPDARPIDGVNLLPVLAGQGGQRGVPIAFEHRHQAALITDRYKLIQTALHDEKPAGRGAEAAHNNLLFDLIADPTESHDLSDTHRELVARLATILREWRTSCRRDRAGKTAP